MDLLPKDVAICILGFLSSDLKAISLASKKYNQLATDVAKEKCLEWWRTNLKFRGDYDLSTQWSLNDRIFPILQENFTIDWKSLWLGLETKIDIWDFERLGLNSILGFEKSSTFLRIGYILVQFWPPDPPGWAWLGPHIKIFRIRTSSGYQYQMLITDHGDEFDLNSGTIVLENGSQVKGMIISGTTRVNDDGIEYLFMSVPQQIIVKNKVFEERNCCSEYKEIMFRCCACHVNFCFYCCQNHGIDNCSVPPEKWDSWMWRSMKGRGAWVVVQVEDGEIKCGDKFAGARNKMGTLQSYYDINYYYDSDSDEVNKS